MECDCIFYSLLYLDVSNIIKCLMINKTNSNFNTEYLWKLLCDRDFMDSYNKMDKYYESQYMVYFHLHKIKNELLLKGTLNDIRDMNSLERKYKKIKHLSKSIFVLKNLRKIDLTGNLLRKIPDEIYYVANLSELILSNNLLCTIPTEIGYLPMLHKLDLSQNCFETIPSELGNLEFLTELDLHDNYLKTIPSELGKLDGLTSINLGHNFLETIPSEIGNMIELKYLILDHNGLKTIPSELGKLSKLESLDLEGNKRLQFIPKELGYYLTDTNENLDIIELIEKDIFDSYLITRQKFTKRTNGEMLEIIL